MIDYYIILLETTAIAGHRSRIRYLSKKNSRILTNFPKLKKFVKIRKKNSLNARVYGCRGYPGTRWVPR